MTYVLLNDDTVYKVGQVFHDYEITDIEWESSNDRKDGIKVMSQGQRLFHIPYHTIYMTAYV